MAEAETWGRTACGEARSSGPGSSEEPGTPGPGPGVGGGDAVAGPRGLSAAHALPSSQESVGCVPTGIHTLLPPVWVALSLARLGRSERVGRVDPRGGRGT